MARLGAEVCGWARLGAERRGKAGRAWRVMARRVWQGADGQEGPGAERIGAERLGEAGRARLGLDGTG